MLEVFFSGPEQDLEHKEARNDQIDVSSLSFGFIFVSEFAMFKTLPILFHLCMRLLEIVLPMMPCSS